MAPGGLRAEAGQELQEAKAGDAVARVLGQAKAREHVLDVGGLEEFQAAEFHERDVAPRQLELERGAVMRGAEEHRLRLERHARLAILEQRVGDEARLVGLVADGDERAAGRRSGGRTRGSW